VPRIGVIAALTVIVFMAVRVPIMWLEPDWGTTEMDQFGLFAAHLVSGLLGPPADYLPQPHQGCTFLFGAWCAPIIAIGGPDVGSLRLCSLTLHAAVAAIFVLLAGRLAGWKGALGAGALFVLAPPMLAHYAQKGSTNHDDCEFFIGLALLLLIAPEANGRGRQALVRSGLSGLLVGLAAAYMLDGGLRGLIVLGLALLVWQAGRLQRATAMLAGGVAAVVWAALMGVGKGEVIQVAFSESNLWAESGGEPGPPLGERIGQLFDYALPTGFRVSGPDLWGWLPMSEGALLYSYPVALLLMAGLGAVALRDSRPEGESTEARRGVLLLVLSCATVAVLQCAAVVLAGLEVEVDYIVPIWPYLVVLAAGGLAVGPQVRWRRARQIGGVLVLAVALLLCFEGMERTLAPFYGGRDLGTDSKVQSRFAGSLRAARPERHGFGQNLIERQGADGIRQLLREDPRSAPGLLRLLGQAEGLQVAERACGLERGPAIPNLPGDLPPHARPLFWQGVGEQLATSAEPCALVTGGPSNPGWDQALLDALQVGTAGEESAWEGITNGLAMGLMELGDGIFNGLERGFQEERERRSLCLAAGQWAFETMRPVEVQEWLDPAGMCSDEEFAVGWGTSVARNVAPGAKDPPEPRYRWWWPELGDAAGRAFDCGYRTERAVVLALTTSTPPPRETKPCLP